jgi:hypothetical protein
MRAKIKWPDGKDAILIPRTAGAKREADYFLGVVKTIGILAAAGGVVAKISL